MVKLKELAIPEGWSASAIALLATLMIALHLLLRFAGFESPTRDYPLLASLLVGGVPLVAELLWKLSRREFGSDLLAGISIVTSVLLHEYLAGAIVVLMLSGGSALEAYAVRSASSVLRALAKRTPTTAHRRSSSGVEEIPLDHVAVGDELIVLPHQVCPVDGTVLEGRGVMDESYLTGEPFLMSKAPGASVLSGAVNGDAALTIRADKLAIDSRYSKIMQVMQQTEQRRPRLRRLGDQLGALYTPLAVVVALLAWGVSGEPVRFLAVLVVATPCPLLIAIPVAIIGAISLCAKRSIIVRDPAVLETIDRCRTIIFDKTGTLTYGKPELIERVSLGPQDRDEVLRLAASLEVYSKHPLAEAIQQAARNENLPTMEASEVHEPPGAGLQGVVGERRVRVTGRHKLAAERPAAASALPPATGGLECLVLVDEQPAALYRFRDTPRREGELFVNHLSARHRYDRVMLVSGDRESEVRYLAEQVGIDEVYFGQSPEQKLAITQRERARVPTVFVGDGINDAPALLAATVGIAMGQESEVTSEAAGVVVMDSSLQRVDEFMHISRHMRRIALQSAVGGIALSVGGMLLAAFGLLTPVAGAVAQEIIDVVAVTNALRAALPPRTLTDY